jgi:hypothetical protein
MEKLKLNLDDLKVESFDTTPMLAQETKGTVYGYSHQQTHCYQITECQHTCAQGNTCAWQMTCGLCTGQEGCSAQCTNGCSNQCQNTDQGSTCLCW